MDSHAYFEDFEVRYRTDKFNHEAEQWRLSRLAEGQDGEDPARSGSAPGNPLVAWVGRAVSPVRVALDGARSRWVDTGKPQEQCC